jgi:hypothetical protein
MKNTPNLKIHGQNDLIHQYTTRFWDAIFLEALEWVVGLSQMIAACQSSKAKETPFSYCVFYCEPLNPQMLVSFFKLIVGPIVGPSFWVLQITMKNKGMSGVLSGWKV